MTHYETLQKIIADLTATLPEADKFDQGNDRAGVRLRKATLTGSQALGQLRKTVQEDRTRRKGS
jgi:hypothetical protein